MKRERSDMVYSLLLVPLDAVALLLAGFVTWYLRFRTEFLALPVASDFPLQRLFVIGLWVIPIFLVIFALARLYTDHREQRFLDELGRVVLALSTGMLGLIVFLFFRQEVETSRFVIVAGLIVAIIFVGLARYGLRLFERHQRIRGRGVHTVVIVGENETSRLLRKNFRENPEQGVRVIDVVAHQDIDHIVRELKRLAETNQITEIIQTNSDLPQSDVEQLLDFADEYKLRFKFTPNIFETQATNIGIGTVAGVPIVELKKTPLEGWGRIGKRAVDLVGSSIGLAILSPFFLVVALAIKFDTEGPVFERMPRVGKYGPFLLYKFRSMIKNARYMKVKLMKYNERSGPLFKMKNDPRVTRVGRIIRRTSFDEFGQLINVFKGEMSLVGPRPHEPEEVARYQKHHKKLLTIKPGITGLAAISGRSDLDFEDEVRLDTYYIEHWSLGLDLKILLRTIPAVLSRKAAV